MKQPSDDFILKVRQSPERAKVTGPKEKDRKPVDPPPIVQLQIRDPSDPAQNYLQSPYYFMCADLHNTNAKSPEDSVSQSALAGTLASSLHRLKDVDNLDAGFFVFGDLSVKVEGHYRLRFNLFELRNLEVVYIKSVFSNPFYVYSPKEFPGMTESTFLSRSFGDQGVRLRIRKEPRTLLKRQHQTVGGGPSQGYNGMHPGYPQPPRPEYGYQAPVQQDHSQQAHYLNAPDYNSPPAKRQRKEFATPGPNAVYEPDSRHGLSSNYTTPHPHVVSQGQAFMPGQQSALGSYTDYAYGHQRNNSSNTSSPYISPHEPSGYQFQFTQGQGLPQYSAREVFPSYPQPTHVETQHRYAPQSTYPAPLLRQERVSVPLRMEAPVASSQPAARALTSLAQAHVSQSVTSHGVEEPMEPTADPPLRGPGNLTLPPLHTLPSSQTLGTAPQLQSSNVLPRIENHGPGPISRQSDPQGHHDVSVTQ